MFIAGQCLAQNENTRDEDDGEAKKVTPQFRIPTSIGNWMVGANLLLANVQIQDGEDAYLNIGVSPKAGFFILPNIAIGGSIDFSFAGRPSEDYRLSYGITPFARAYFAHNNTARSKPLQFFIEGGAGFAGITDHTKTGSVSADITTTGGRFYLMPGIDYFLNSHVALEGGLQYLYITGSPNSQVIGLNVGFQIFLGR
jgi:hypothetical protein